MSKPNPADFSVREFPREYYVTLTIEGTMSVTIKADNMQEARDMAEAYADRIANGIDEADLDETDDASVSDVYKRAPIFRVLRNGNPSQVTHLRDGDLPREPDERGG